MSSSTLDRLTFWTHSDCNCSRRTGRNHPTPLPPWPGGPYPRPGQHPWNEGDNSPKPHPEWDPCNKCVNGIWVPDLDRIARDSKGYAKCVDDAEKGFKQELDKLTIAYNIILQAIELKRDAMYAECDRLNCTGTFEPACIAAVVACKRGADVLAVEAKLGASATYLDQVLGLQIGKALAIHDCRNRFPCHK